MIWYVRCGECEIGPLGEEALRALVGTGRIIGDTPLWREGLPAWTAAVALPGVLGPRAAAPPAPGLQAAGAPGASRPAAPASRDGSTAHELAPPWRRYWARSFDLLVGFGVTSLLFGVIWPGLFTRLNGLTGQKWVVLLVLLPLALAVDAVLYSALRSTPGKAIAGIKVLDESGRRALGIPAYVGRTFGVYVFGLGLGVPLVSLGTLIYGYRLAAAAKPAVWERLSGSRVHVLADAGPRTWITAGVYLLAVMMFVALGRHEKQSEARYSAARVVTPNILRQELTEAANSVNATAPRMIDGITRLDGARVGPGPLFTYEYTLTSLQLSTLSTSALETLRWRLSADVRRAVCRGKALEPMLVTGTTVRFQYHDRDGLNLVRVSISRGDCGQ